MQLTLPLAEPIAGSAHAPTANARAPDYQLVRSTRRTLAINIHQGEVIVRAPLRAPLAWIQDFVDAKAAWINCQVELQRVQKNQLLKIVDGATFTLFGQACCIAIEAADTRKRSRLQFTDNCLSIAVQTPSDKQATPANQHSRLFRRWLKSQAPAYLNSNTQLLARRMGLAKKLAAVNYRYTSSKWGHCTSSGEIQYNPSIALAPLYVTDYIIAHEVCHLRHRNHSRRFWSLVASVCPQWQQAEHWLDNDGHRISIGN
ncbi:MAG: M48 family metallopeptidase [Pseudomonadales bacterium]|nr:M48 family metallopeptidase [Pseudomonadales bacterium]